MRISYNWLKEYVDLKESIESLSDMGGMGGMGGMM